MYLNFIRPLLEYGDVVWDNCTAELTFTPLKSRKLTPQNEIAALHRKIRAVLV